MAQTTASVTQVVRAVRDTTSLPIIVKFPYLSTGVREYVTAALDGGADILSMINTVPSIMPYRHPANPHPQAHGTGGLSGPTIKPLALRMIYEARAITDAPIIGIGGIRSFDDVLDYFHIGANIVAVGTAIFTNRRVFADISRSMRDYMHTHSLTDIPALMAHVRAQ